MLSHGVDLGWGQPDVRRRGGDLWLEIWVPMGAFETSYEVPVDPEHVAVLRDDFRRYLMVWHSLVQVLGRHRHDLVAQQAAARECLDLICFGTEAEVSAHLGREHRDVAIELVGFGGDYDRMLGGSWFDAHLPTTPVAYDNDLRERQIKTNQARRRR
ncbi:hypothetical protein GCM10009795_007150 [Nocardioides hankookensis]